MINEINIQIDNKEPNINFSNAVEVNDLVSIIIPVYNAEKFLHKCITSVLAQTYKNFELILISDCPTDTSAEICENFALKDSRIVFKRLRTNHGASYARNQGLELAKGKYISFVDADDFIENNFFHTLLMLLKNFDCDMSGCAILKDIQDSKKPVKNKNYCITILSHIEAIQNIIAENCLIPALFVINSLSRYNKRFKI